MSTTRNRIAAVLAFVIGGMAVFAGGKVLVGIDPGYPVVDWLPLYNYTLGLLSIVLTAFLLWTGHRLAVPAAVGTFSLHALVMLTLQTAYRGVVAAESLQAMTLRLAVWAVILGLVLVRSRRAAVKRSRPGALAH